MSRAFHPPDTLSKEDVRKIADVRRDVWTSGFKGLFYGSAIGYTMHTTSKIIYTKILKDDNSKNKNNIKTKINKLFKVTKKQPLFTKNTAFLSFLAGGALGSFLMATTTGKNEIHELHDIFHINEKKKETKTKYQKIVDDAAASSLSYDGQSSINVDNKILTGGNINDNDNDDDNDNSNTRKQRRLSRRKTVAHRLSKGRGLSDSHGGHWILDDNEKEGGENATMTQTQRTIRRKSMTKRLEEGRGLSDSHSGKWQS